MNMKQIREVAQELPTDVMQAGRQVWLAGLGAAGIVTTGGEAVFSMLVEEGKRVKKLDRGRRDRRPRRRRRHCGHDPVKAAVKKLDTSVQSTTKTMLARIGVPSRRKWPR